MVRTRIYLTEHQHDGLAAIARDEGKRQSDLIRESGDRFIEQAGRSRREAILNEAAGIWRNRSDLPDCEAMRAGWDRD